MKRACLFVCAIALFPACGGNLTVSAGPHSVATLQQACSLTEVNCYLVEQSKNDSAAVTRAALHMRTVASSGSGEGKQADVKSGAEVDQEMDFELSRLPTAAQCDAFHYIPQLGQNGCMESKELGSCQKVEPGQLDAACKAARQTNAPAHTVR